MPLDRAEQTRIHLDRAEQTRIHQRTRRIPATLVRRRIPVGMPRIPINLVRRRIPVGTQRIPEEIPKGIHQEQSPKTRRTASAFLGKRKNHFPSGSPQT